VILAPVGAKVVTDLDVGRDDVEPIDDGAPQAGALADGGVSITIESSITAPSLTHTDRPRIELRIVARLTSDDSPICALSMSAAMNRAAGPA